MTKIHIRFDGASREGCVCDQYRWEGPGMPEVLDRFGLQFASALELKNAITNAGLKRFIVATPGPNPTVLERECTPEILIDRFLANGQERWQSLIIIDAGRQDQNSQ